MLILSQVRFLVDIAVTYDAISLESRCVWHDNQVVQVHQEAQEVEEGLGEYLVWIISLWSVEKVPNILNGLGLLLQFVLIECLDETETVQNLGKIVHGNCLGDVSW